MGRIGWVRMDGWKSLQTKEHCFAVLIKVGKNYIRDVGSTADLVLVFFVYLVHLVHMVRQVHLVHLVHPVHLVHLVLVVHQVLVVLVVLVVLLDS